jgi:hypothetical protein
MDEKGFLRVENDDLAQLMLTHFRLKFINNEEIILLRPDKETVWKVVVKVMDPMKD